MAADTHAVGLRDLRHHTSEVLARVRHGETVDITEHGRLIARIVPAGDRAPTPILERLWRQAGPPWPVVPATARACARGMGPTSFPRPSPR